MIAGIDHIVRTVRDTAFDVRRLEAVSFGGGRRALRFGQQMINLQTLGQKLAHLAAEAVPVVERPVAKSGALGPITSVYINDPDGNLVEIARDGDAP